jgi:hypothetical protein
MRLAGLLLLLCAVGATAQDTNFATGPQYLIPPDATFLRPISTPSLSLGTPLPPLPSEPETSQPVTNQAYVENPGLEHQADLFPIYYGYPRVSTIELTSPEETAPLPESLTNFGYAAVTDAQSLRELGYGIPLGDAASYQKAHRLHAPRVFTNADIQRLHPS